jgi:hypothetical protein
VNRFRRLPRLDKTPIRLPVRPANRRAERSLKQTLFHAARMVAPTPLALSLASVAHAQGTMDFSGAQTLMGTFNVGASAVQSQVVFPNLRETVPKQPMRTLQGH